MRSRRDFRETGVNGGLGGDSVGTDVSSVYNGMLLIVFNNKNEFHFLREGAVEC